MCDLLNTMLLRPWIVFVAHECVTLTLYIFQPCFSIFNYWTRSHSKELTDWPVTSKADFPQVLKHVISSERFTLTVTQTSPKTVASHICVGRILPSFCICCELVVLSTKCKIYAMKKKVCDETFLCIDQNISKEKQKSKRALRTRLNWVEPE